MHIAVHLAGAHCGALSGELSGALSGALSVVLSGPLSGAHSSNKQDEIKTRRLLLKFFFLFREDEQIEGRILGILLVIVCCCTGDMIMDCESIMNSSALGDECPKIILKVLTAGASCCLANARYISTTRDFFEELPAS